MSIGHRTSGRISWEIELSAVWDQPAVLLNGGSGQLIVHSIFLFVRFRGEADIRETATRFEVTQMTRSGHSRPGTIGRSSGPSRAVPRAGLL
jgi:hypothetical protein